MPEVPELTHIRDTCPLCGGSSRRPFAATEEAALARCAACGMVYLESAAPETGSYDPEYYVSYGRRWKLKVARDRWRTRLLERFRAPGRLLDMGCALGYFVAAARQRGWEAYGMDVAHTAAAGTAAHGLPAVVGLLDRPPFAEATFDAITLWHVIEHVPEPRPFVAAARRLLRPGGLLVVDTPNVAHLKPTLAGSRWRHIHPHHVCYFSTETLTRLLREEGFRVALAWRFRWKSVVTMIGVADR
jgi:SAM-dependent methyltransferase